MSYKPEFITRHRDLVTDAQLSSNIHVVGAGAIGSFTVLALAKMGFHNITVYDFDTVEAENVGNQFYPPTCIGKPKVTALAEMVQAFTGIAITPVIKQINKDDMLSCDILVCAVDSMKVRKMLFDHCAACFYLIDPRMGAEYATMEVVPFQEKEARISYQKTLFSDESAMQERCTAKTTIYTVLLISGQVVKAIKDVTGKQDYIRSLDWNINKNAMLAWSNHGSKL